MGKSEEKEGRKRKINEIASTSGPLSNENDYDDEDDDDDSDFDPDAIENSNKKQQSKTTRTKKRRRGFVASDNKEDTDDNEEEDKGVEVDLEQNPNQTISKNRELLIAKAEATYDELMTRDRMHYSRQNTSVSSRLGCEIFAIIGGEKVDEKTNNPWMNKKGKNKKEEKQKGDSKKRPPKKQKNRFELLSSIFGQTRASRVVGKPVPPKDVKISASRPSVTNFKPSKVSATNANGMKTKNAVDDSNNSKVCPSTVNNSIPTFKAPTKIQISETFKYAGKEVVIEREVDADSKFAQEHQTKQKKSGLDKLLDDIKGPQNLSTVGKSNMDWKDYKKEKGLDEELEIAAKDGYISKQEFLQRVDHRQFEQERDDRLREQAKRQGL